MRKEFLLDRFRRVFRIDAEGPGQFADRLVDAAGPLGPGLDGVALSDGVADHVLEGLVGGFHDCRCQRLAERAVRIRRGFQQNSKRQLVEQLRGRGFVQHSETRGDIGLERELVQQPRAESVDGLHLQAARRLQRGSKQPARARAFLGAWLGAGRERDLLVERGVGKRGPAGQPLEHLVRHVGGGGLGEGDAEDFRRIDAAQQQVDHALGENIGLARAGIGRDEGRDVRVGSLDLHAAHGRGDFALGRHGAALATRQARFLSPWER